MLTARSGPRDHRFTFPPGPVIDPCPDPVRRRLRVPSAARGRLRRRRTHPVRQGQGPVRRDARRRPRHQVHPRAAAPQPLPAARAGRRGRGRGHDPDRRPGPDHRPHRRPAVRAAPERARLLDRPDVRRRHDRGDDHRVRHRLRRVRRRDRRRRRAHGPPPDGRGRGPQPAHPLRADRRPRRPGDGQDRGEPARPLPRRSPRSASTPTPSAPSRRPPPPTPTAASSPTWSRSPRAPPSSAGASRRPTSRCGPRPPWSRWPP